MTPADFLVKGRNGLNHTSDNLAHDRSVKRWLLIELPVVEYEEAWNLQVSLVTARKERSIDTDIILLLEHPPVFTLGRRGGRDNLTVSGDFLKRVEIPVVQVERGGNITFHGPGQLVAYPIIDLGALKLGVTDYVTALEEVMIRVAGEWGVRAQRNPINRGVWVGSKKLGSVGIAVRRGICFHGMAFNVNPSLIPFGWMNPCGLEGVCMTSMEQELSCKVSMREVREATTRHFESVFGVELVRTSLSPKLMCK